MTRRQWWTLPFLLFALVLAPSLRAQPGEPTRVRDVIYNHKDGICETFDVFKPANPNGIGVIWMVSGGWVSNHNSINAGLAKMFTDRGQTVFQVVHGTQPKFIIPEIVKSIHRAVRYIRVHAKEFGVDPNRLGISGGSAGGHLSLMIGAYGGPGDANAKDEVDRASSAVQAVAIFFPPTDFLNYGKEGVKAMDIPALRLFAPAFGINDKTPTETLEKMSRDLSPYYGVTDKMPPTLIIHGDADTLVPIQQSERLMAKLEELKVPHKLEVKPGKSHGWAGMEKDASLLADWFDKYLGKK